MSSLRWWPAIAALLLIAGVLAARGAEWYQTSDFFCLYHGSHALVIGRDPYDEAYWASVTGGERPLPTFRGGQGATACPGRYGYPLWTAVALLPLGAMPLEVAASLWAAASIGAAIAGMAWSWRAFAGPRSLAVVFAALVVFSPMFWLLLISGQPTGVELGIAGLVALSLARGWRRIAGVGLGAMALKPQLVGITIPAVLLRALFEQRALVVSALLTLAAMTFAAMAFRPGWMFEWLGEISGRRLRVTTLLPTAWGLAGDLMGNAAFGAIFIAVLLLGVGLIVRGTHPSTLDVFVLSLPISLFATPYAWSYDHLVFVPCWAYVLARAATDRRRRVPMLLAVAAAAVLLPWPLYGLAFSRGVETLTATVPALTAVLVALALRMTVE